MRPVYPWGIALPPSARFSSSGGLAIFPLPPAPSPCPSLPPVSSDIAGGGEVFSEGWGSRAPPPFRCFLPLSATHLVATWARSAERGQGVRLKPRPISLR